MPLSEDSSGEFAGHGYRTWSSEKLPPAEQFEFWRQSVHQVFGPMRMSREESGGFRMKIAQTRLGALTLSSVQAQAHRADRDQVMADRDTTGLVYINVPRAGTLNGRQFSRELTVDEGWVGMLAGHQPASVVAKGEFRQYVIGLPAELVTRRLADPAVAGIVSGVLPTLLTRMTDFLFTHASRFGRDEAALLAEQVTDLVISSFGASGSGPRQLSRVVLQAAMDEAMRRLGDHLLTVEELARHANVSRRTLEKLFAERGTTPARWIQHRRLDGARRQLIATASRSLSVEQIADRWGFADRTHFSRVFRARFSVSPAAFRRTNPVAPGSPSVD